MRGSSPLGPHGHVCGPSHRTDSSWPASPSLASSSLGSLASRHVGVQGSDGPLRPVPPSGFPRSRGKGRARRAAWGQLRRPRPIRDAQGGPPGGRRVQACWGLGGLGPRAGQGAGGPHQRHPSWLETAGAAGLLVSRPLVCGRAQGPAQLTSRWPGMWVGQG